MTNHLQHFCSRPPYVTSSAITTFLLLGLLASPTICAALPVALNSLLHPRQIEPVQGCAYSHTWVYGGNVQTSQSDCTAAAQEMCGKIPFEAWAIDDWTKVDVGSCRAMVFHNDHMPVPTVEECMATYGAIIPTCIVQTDGKPDGGWANVNPNIGSDSTDIWEDETKTVYSIGSGAWMDKEEQMNIASTAAIYISQGAAMVHA